MNLNEQNNLFGDLSIAEEEILSGGSIWGGIKNFFKKNRKPIVTGVGAVAGTATGGVAGGAIAALGGLFGSLL